MSQADLDEVKEATAILFNQYGIENTLDNRQHFGVMLRCLVKVQVRTEAYGQVWKQYGGVANLLSAARKVDRLMSIFWNGKEPEMHKDALDDAEDGINYLVFFMRLAAKDNLVGQAPQRPADGKLISELVDYWPL